MRHIMECPMCKRHDLGTQELNWNDIFGFNFIYVKVIAKRKKKRKEIVESMRSR